MFEHESRYANIPTATHAEASGRQVAYKRRRILPVVTGVPLIAEVTVIEGDRLDLIAARTLGAPEQFWRICDSNNAMRPDDLTNTPGAVIQITSSQP